MKYFSTELKKVFDTVEELEAAELEAAKKKDARKEMADKVQAASKAVSDAYEAYRNACKERDELLAAFCKEYGSYKTTVRSEDIRNLDPLQELLNFRFFSF